MNNNIPYLAYLAPANNEHILGTLAYYHTTGTLTEDEQIVATYAKNVVESVNIQECKNVLEALAQHFNGDGLAVLLPDEPSSDVKGLTLEGQMAIREMPFIGAMGHLQLLGKPYNRPYGLSANLKVSDEIITKWGGKGSLPSKAEGSDKTDYIPINVELTGDSAVVTSGVDDSVKAIYAQGAVPFIVQFASIQ